MLQVINIPKVFCRFYHQANLIATNMHDCLGDDVVTHLIFYLRNISYQIFLLVTDV
jgi:hypothetical protein